MKKLFAVILLMIFMLGTVTSGVGASSISTEESSVENVYSAENNNSNTTAVEKIGENSQTQPVSQEEESITLPTQEIQPVVTEKVFLSTSSTTLGVGESFEIYGYVKDGNTLPSLEWYTSDETVAYVEKTNDNTAIITGAGTGKAVVKAITPDGEELECSVTVRKAPQKITLSKSALCLGKGENLQVNASTDGTSWSQNIEWKSSNTKVAEVSTVSRGKAKITAKGVGTAVISVTTYNGKTATCKVTVKAAPVWVKLNVSSLQLGKGEPCIIYETVNDNSFANTQNVKWISYNTKVVAVAKAENNKCVVTAKGVGKAKIAVKLYNGKTASCVVTVKPAPKSVKINKGNIKLKLKKTVNITAVLSKNSFSRSITWESSNPKVAKVVKTSQNRAKIISKKTGKAVITVRLFNGKTAKCNVTVYRAKIFLSPSSQKENTYVVGNTNEMEQCYRMARYAKTALERNGFLVKMPSKEGQSYQKNVKESNKWGADFHIPIHTNGLFGNTLGTMVMVHQKKGQSYKAAKCLLDSVGSITPGSDFEIKSEKGLYELNYTKANAVYIEVEFHDNVKGAKWIINNSEKAGNSIAKGICDYYNIKFV
ncbi:MAG: N-acetylmuramoyl-L-alanine amidase [Ruminococcus sp.]